ncbi:MAG: hypothetical protein KIS76_00405 [Pyrinomonadaceae bacterium]|nr:hypothetical protein [Pyrinomonadaceae bacterium]
MEKSEVLVAEKETRAGGFTLDTSFVLFFLAIEFGRSAGGFGFETAVMALALVAAAVLPYFINGGEQTNFANWILGRFAIAGFAVVLGVGFNQSLGAVFPEEFRFLPMTLLIISAICSFVIQFDGFFRFRLAK